MPQRRKRKLEPDTQQGLAVWTDSLSNTIMAARAANEMVPRIPIWLLVLVLTVWLSVILVTSAYLVAYALKGLPPITVLAGGTLTAQPTASVPAVVATATTAATRTRIPTYTPRPVTPTATRTLTPTLKPTTDEAYAQEAVPTDTLPPTEEPTSEPATATPTETPTATALPSPTPLPNPHEARLIGVLDGATIEVEFGGQSYRVRFQGVMVPNKDNADTRIADAGRRAEELTTLLVQATPLLLERDVTDADTDGALLRYVFAGGRNVGLELVRQGLATVVLSLTDSRYQDALYAAQLAAQADCLGIWTCP